MHLNLYKFVHTTVRGQLSQLMIQAGKTIYSNPEEVLALYNLTCDVAVFLRSHGEHEDKFIHPKIKEKKFPKMSEIEKEHDAIEVQLETLILQITALKDETANTKKDDIKEKGYQFYLTLADFLVAYFAHMNVEEREIMPFLLKTLSYDEIFSMEMDVRASISEAEMLTMIPMMYPYIDYEEALQLTGILKDFSNFKDIAVAIEKCLHSEFCKRIFNEIGCNHSSSTSATVR
ncbi:MAG: hemerythrin domain-containing protein [Candidatus Rhabdochlamydia sp.]